MGAHPIRTSNARPVLCPRCLTVQRLPYRLGAEDVCQGCFWPIEEKKASETQDAGQ